MLFSARHQAPTRLRQPCKSARRSSGKPIPTSNLQRLEVGMQRNVDKDPLADHRGVKTTAIGRSMKGKITMPATGSSEEKRKFDRVPETVSITIQKIAYPLTEEAPVEAVGKNISVGGICFAVPRSFEPGDLLSLKIGLTGWQRHKNSYAAVIDDDLALAPLTAVAKVSWCKALPDTSDFEIGVIFENIYEDDYKALKKYLSIEPST
jgi:hypothetical protein